MAKLLSALKELHAFRKELTDVRDQIRRGPLQLKAKQDDLARREKEIADERERVTRFRMNSDQLELNLKTTDQRVRDLRVKLNTASSNKEYTAIKEEIDKLLANNGKLEDEIIQLLGQQEEMSAKVDGLRANLKEAEQERDKLKEVVDYQAEKLNGRLTWLEAKIAEIEKQLDTAALAEYRRLSKRMGDDALASCSNYTCGHCFSAQPPQSGNDLACDRLVKCKTCGSILYLE